MSGRRLRMVQVTHGMGIGGMERVILDLCRNLDPSRYEITVYCTHILGPLAPELDRIGVPVVYHAVRRRSDHWMRPMRIAKYLRETRPDIVHTQHNSALLDAALPARLTGVPVLVHTDHSKHYPTERRRYMMAERALSGLVDSFCAVSRHTRDEIAAYEGIRAERIEVVHNGFDFAELPGRRDRDEIRATLGIDETAPLLGSIARLVWQKGHDLLIDAMPAIRAAIPEAQAVIVGGGSREGELRERIHSLGLEGAVHLMGWRNDATRFLPAIDLFVMTSNFEGMPISLLEAMALSRPVLSTAVGGVPEIVLDGVTGRLVDGRDPAVFARTAIEMIRDRNRLSTYGAAGRARYDANFRVSAMVDAYDRIYRRCVETRLGRPA